MLWQSLLRQRIDQLSLFLSVLKHKLSYLKGQSSDEKIYISYFYNHFTKFIIFQICFFLGWLPQGIYTRIWNGIWFRVGLVLIR